MLDLEIRRTRVAKNVFQEYLNLMFTRAIDVYFARCRRGTIERKDISIINIEFIIATPFCLERFVAHQRIDATRFLRIDFIDALLENQPSIHSHFDVVDAAMKLPIRDEPILCKNLNADISYRRNRCTDRIVVAISIRIEFLSSKPVVYARVNVQWDNGNFLHGRGSFINNFTESKL